MADINCLKTTIKNVSGAVLKVPTFPPHGKTFAVGESVSFPGDIEAHFARYRKPWRILDSFEALILAGSLTVIKTPSPVMYDTTLDRTSILNVNNGALYAKDPCWASTAYSSPL